MKREGPTKHIKKVMSEIVEKDRTFSSVLPHFLYFGSPLRRLDDLALLLNEYQYDERVEKIIEALVSQSPSKMDWVEGGSRRGFEPSRLFLSPGNRLDPAPGSPLDLLNNLVSRIPFVLEFRGYRNNKTGAIEIESGCIPTSIDGFAKYLVTGRIPPIDVKDCTVEVVWLLWEIYFRNIGLDRFKRCPQCKRWFVDRTRNRQKERCSKHCTWQWWSWGRRKEEGHNLPESKKRKKRKDR